MCQSFLLLISSKLVKHPRGEQKHENLKLPYFNVALVCCVVYYFLVFMIKEVSNTGFIMHPHHLGMHI